MTKEKEQQTWESVILATHKEETIRVFREFYAVSLGILRLAGFNPEEGQDDPYLEAKLEPQGEDPKEAAFHKARRAVYYIVLKYLYLEDGITRDKLSIDDAKRLTELDLDLAVVGGDVIAIINGNNVHRLDRTTDGAQQKNSQISQEDINTLRERYGSGPVDIEWQLGFAVFRNNRFQVGSTSIVTTFPRKITDEELRRYYDAGSNTGLRLIELCEECGEPPSLFLKPEQDQDKKQEISYELAKQLIVAKVPTPEMLAELTRIKGELSLETGSIAPTMACSLIAAFAELPEVEVE